jgi:23S rRNA pseudouridine2605 synthase
MAQELMHPSKGVEKEYEVIVDKPFTQKDGAALLKGTWIEGSVARVESVRILAPTKIALVLHQGLKRQIRVMLGLIGFKVQRLIRIRLGPLTLRGLKPGSYREMRPEDLEALRKALSVPKPKRAPAPAKPKPKALTFTNFTVIPASGKTAEAATGPQSRGRARSGGGTASRVGARTTRSTGAKPARKTSPTAARVRKPKG